jgi:hypothetical protein
MFAQWHGVGLGRLVLDKHIPKFSSIFAEQLSLFRCMLQISSMSRCSCIAFGCFVIRSFLTP